MPVQVRQPLYLTRQQGNGFCATFHHFRFVSLSISLLGLFEAHKLLFSFQMTIKIQEVESGLNREELNFFIKGNISLEKVMFCYHGDI